MYEMLLQFYRPTEKLPEIAQRVIFYTDSHIVEGVDLDVPVAKPEHKSLKCFSGFYTGKYFYNDDPAQEATKGEYTLRDVTYWAPLDDWATATAFYTPYDKYTIINQLEKLNDKEFTLPVMNVLNFELLGANLENAHTIERVRKALQEKNISDESKTIIEDYCTRSEARLNIFQEPKKTSERYDFTAELATFCKEHGYCKKENSFGLVKYCPLYSIEDNCCGCEPWHFDEVKYDFIERVLETSKDTHEVLYFQEME